LVFAPILRSGLTFVEGMLKVIPAARVAHVGPYRDPQTFAAVEYYLKVPSDISERLVVVVEPVLATGNTAVAAVERLKESGAKQIRFVSLLCAQGFDQFHNAHPDVSVWTAAIDSAFNEHACPAPWRAVTPAL
jgi:uracil phosphoribosyltransferase